MATTTLNVRTTFRFFRSIFRTSAPLHSASPLLDASALFRTFPHFSASSVVRCFRTFPHFSAFSAFPLFSLLTYSLFVFSLFIYSIVLFVIVFSQFSIVLYFVYSSDHFLAEVLFFSFRIPC